MAEGITKNCLQQINNIYKSRPKKGRKICQSSDTGTEWFTWFVSLKEGKQRKGRTTQEPDWNEWQQILNHHQYGRMISGRYSSEYQQSLVPKAAFQLLDFRIVQTLFLASMCVSIHFKNHCTCSHFPRKIQRSESCFETFTQYCTLRLCFFFPQMNSQYFGWIFLLCQPNKTKLSSFLKLAVSLPSCET